LHAREEFSRADPSSQSGTIGTKGGMLKKGSAPMTAHERDPEAIIQRSGMDMDEAKDVQRTTVDGASEFLRSWIVADIFGKLGKLEKMPLRSHENLRRLTFNRESRTWSKVKLGRSVARRRSLGGPT
jgi:hypothetical protein